MSQADELSPVKLTALGQRLLAIPQDQIEQLLESLEAYLADFDVWQSRVTAINPLGDESSLSQAARAALRSELEELSTVHRQVLDVAQQNRDRVHARIGDVRKRAQALKAYIDRYPSRITIAGKREG